jgi:hypothetical protein
MHVTGQWFGHLLVEAQAPPPELQVDFGNRQSDYTGNFRRRDAAHRMTSTRALSRRSTARIRASSSRGLSGLEFGQRAQQPGALERLGERDARSTTGMRHLRLHLCKTAIHE